MFLRPLLKVATEVLSQLVMHSTTEEYMGGGGGEGVGVLDQCLVIWVLLRAWKPDPFKDKRKKSLIATLSRTSFSILGPCLMQTIFNNGNVQRNTLFTTDSDPV